MSATDDIVSGIMAKWAENFSAFDPDGQASLYSKNALFYGSKPTLYRGRDGVASYFNGLAKWSSREVTFADVVAVPAEIRVYNQLFANPNPSAANFAADLNPQSLEILLDARVEPSVASDNSNEVIQFERQGYFVRDKDSAPGKPVFNRTIGLRDTFAKEVAKS